MFRIEIYGIPLLVSISILSREYEEHIALNPSALFNAQRDFLYNIPFCFHDHTSVVHPNIMLRTKVETVLRGYGQRHSVNAHRRK